jgi:hypothetical protein
MTATEIPALATAYASAPLNAVVDVLSVTERTALVRLPNGDVHTVFVEIISDVCPAEFEYEDHEPEWCVSNSHALVAIELADGKALCVCGEILHPGAPGTRYAHTVIHPSTRHDGCPKTPCRCGNRQA